MTQPPEMPVGQQSEEFGNIEIITVTDRASLTVPVPPGKSPTGKLILMRDSSKPEDGTLVFDENEWNAFVLGVKDGEFDLPEDAG
jgi:hypothetical protein